MSRNKGFLLPGVSKCFEVDSRLIEMTVKSKSIGEGEKHTSVSRFVTNIVALRSVHYNEYSRKYMDLEVCINYNQTAGAFSIHLLYKQ